MKDNGPVYKIEKGIEMPNYFKDKYGFAKMEVGDSFEFHGDEIQRNTIASTATYHGNKLGMRFATHKTGEGVFRLWRIK